MSASDTPAAAGDRAVERCDRHTVEVTIFSRLVGARPEPTLREVDLLHSSGDLASYRLPRMQERDGSVVVNQLELVASERERERATTSAGDRNKHDRFDRLMKEHGTMVFHFCLRKLQDRALAEDVHQQVFIAAYRDLDSFEGRSKEGTWLIGIAKHRCQDAKKAKDRRGSREQLDGEAVDDTPDPELDLPSLLHHARVSEMLTGCLDELLASSRQVVTLRFQHGMSYEDMAVELGAKADTLRARCARALPLLKSCLEKKGVKL